MSICDISRPLLKFLPNYYVELLKIKSKRILSKVEVIVILNKFYLIPLSILGEMKYRSLTRLHGQKLLNYLTEQWQLYNYKKGQSIKHIINGGDITIKHPNLEFDIIKELKNYKNPFIDTKIKKLLKIKNKQYQKEYYQRPEVRARIIAQRKERHQNKKINGVENE